MQKLPYETCSICATLPATECVNFLDANHQGKVSIPKAYQPLFGEIEQSLNGGYQRFTISCPKCRTSFKVEVDVEPGVWDMLITRLQ